jgi:hypothetical protein
MSCSKKFIFWIVYRNFPLKRLESFTAIVQFSKVELYCSYTRLLYHVYQTYELSISLPQFLIVIYLLMEAYHRGVAAEFELQ